MGSSQSSVVSSVNSNCLDMSCCAKRNAGRVTSVKQQPKTENNGIKDIQSTIKTRWHSTKSLVSSGFQDSWKSLGSNDAKSSASEDIGADRPSPKRSLDGMRFHVCLLKNAPEPMEGWTAEEQDVLIQEINSHPHSKKSHGYLDRIFVRTHKMLPKKSINEIEQCYSHLQSKQIAYFGVKDEQGRQIILLEFASFSHDGPQLLR